MGLLDWATLIFASYVVTLTVIGELNDTESAPSLSHVSATSWACGGVWSRS